MNLQFVDKYFSPTMFFLAGILITFAIAEALIEIFGYSLSAGLFSPGRIMELSATFLMFAIAHMLWQIRNALLAR